MIVIPSMYSCPELHLNCDVPELRIIARTLTRIHNEGSRSPLCLQYSKQTRNFPKGTPEYRSKEEFENSMRKVLSPHAFLTDYLNFNFNFGIATSLDLRYSWAAHIARSIYEQIGD